MNKGGIEDILIGDNYRNKKKKKGKGVIVLFLLLLILLIVACGYYYYLINMQTSHKELFVANLANSDINNFFKINIYETLYAKLLKSDSEINTSMNFTTTLESEVTKDFDLSKFVVNLKTKNDTETLKSFSELKLNYSDNEIFNAKALIAENEIAISSNEVFEKYIGIHYDKIQEIFNTELDIQELKKIKQSENIDITKEEKEEYIQKYFNKIFENIEEKNFSSKENIVIDNKTNSVNVTAHTLTLTQQELNIAIVNLLENLRNDEELLKKLVSKKSESLSEESNTNNSSITLTPIIPNEPIEENENKEEILQEESNQNERVQDEIRQENNSQAENIEENVQEITEEVEHSEETNTEESTEEINNEENVENKVDGENVEAKPSIPVITINPVGSVTTEKQVENSQISEENNLEEIKLEEIEQENVNKQEELYRNLIKIFFGKKLDLTIEELQKEIDSYIEISKKFVGNGLTLTIYSSTEKIEKVNVILPNLNTLDIEFYQNDENDNSIKLTYLYKKEDKNNGFSLEINKVENNANTQINVIYSFIENEQINKKITLNLKTEGTTSSKEIKNFIILTQSTNQGETKCIVDNLLKFTEVSNLEEINIENCLFLDELPEEERNTTLDDLKNKIINIYTSKKENLNFIDTNTYSAIVDTLIPNVTREEAKNALINKVSSMMGEALDKDQEFTIQNLVDLKIDGYKVTSTVTESSAVIVVDVYTFNIDKNFLLTDVE